MPIPALVQPYLAGLHETKHCVRSRKILYCRPKVVPLLLNLRVVIKADSDTGKLEHVLFQMLQLIPHAPSFLSVGRHTASLHFLHSTQHGICCRALESYKNDLSVN